jgi:hypothetical protein
MELDGCLYKKNALALLLSGPQLRPAFSGRQLPTLFAKPNPAAR